MALTDKIIQDIPQKLSNFFELMRELKEEGRKIGLALGVFDLFHPGQLSHLLLAKEKLGEKGVLVVGLTRDEHVNKGPGHPVFNQTQRAQMLAALECIDFVVIRHSPTGVELIKSIKPNFFFKGKKDDLTEAIIEEKRAVEECGGEFLFTGEVLYSSTALLNKHFGVYFPEAHLFLEGFRRRYSKQEILELFNRIKKLRVLVIGDTIIDQHHYCRPVGMPPKESIISARSQRVESYPGGVLACANHLAGYCNKVDLVTCLGLLDPKEDFIRTHLKPNITPKFFFRDDAPTTVKCRFVEWPYLTKLFELHSMEDNFLPAELEDEVGNYLRQAIKEYDLVVVADFGHGFLEGGLPALISEEAEYLALMSQTNDENIGFNLITKYPSADYICIDKDELRLALHNRHSEVRGLISLLAKEMSARRIIITYGHRPTIAYDREEGFSEIPVFASKVVDKIGAGDAFLALSSPFAYLEGIPVEVAGFIGNVSGALAVGIICNRESVEPSALFSFLTALFK